MTDQTNKDLNPCPFCGGEAESRQYDGDHFVQCIQCFNSTSADHQTEASAIAAWNRRAALADREKREAETDYCDDGLCGDATEENINEWLDSLARAHEWLDVGKPYFSGRDCAALSRLIKNLVAKVDGQTAYEAECQHISAEGITYWKDKYEALVAQQAATVAQGLTDHQIEMLATGFSLAHRNGLLKFARALLAQYGNPARCGLPNGWCIELLDHGMWRISSPSGDSVHIKLDDPRPISEMFRQLCQSLTEQQEGK